MRISVVVPSFNQARFLSATLSSIVNNGYPDTELIVLDGGSTDDSVDVIRAFAGHITFWTSQPDGGQSCAIRDGFERATGEVIGWLNSDDVLSPGALERVATAARQHSPHRIFVGGYEVIDEDGIVQERYDAPPFSSLISRALGPVVCQPGTFFGRDAYCRAGKLDTSLKYGMDRDLWLRLVGANVRFVRIPNVQAQYRMHTEQKGRTHSWLAHAVAEEERARTRYGLAKRDELRWWAARCDFVLQRALRLGYARTLSFRILNHLRLAPYAAPTRD